MGYHAVARQRNYFIAVHKAQGQFLQSPKTVYDNVASLLAGCRDVDVASLFWETDEVELRVERLSSSPKASSVGVSFEEQLSAFERGNLKKYRAKWDSLEKPKQQAVYVLNQNPDKHPSMTLGTPIVPFYPFCLGSPYYIKQNSRKRVSLLFRVYWRT